MSFWAAVPIIGGLLDTIFRGVDELHTSTEEKLALQQKIMATAQPVITLLIQSQAEFDKAVMTLRVAEIQSGDRFIRWSRPLMGWMTFVVMGYALYTNHPQAEATVWLFGIVNGLWSATRGAEKIVGHWANGGGK